MKLLAIEILSDFYILLGVGCFLWATTLYIYQVFRGSYKQALECVL